MGAQDTLLATLGRGVIQYRLLVDRFVHRRFDRPHEIGAFPEARRI